MPDQSSGDVSKIVRDGPRCPFPIPPPHSPFPPGLLPPSPPQGLSLHCGQSQRSKVSMRVRGSSSASPRPGRQASGNAIWWPTMTAAPARAALRPASSPSSARCSASHRHTPHHTTAPGLWALPHAHTTAAEHLCHTRPCNALGLRRTVSAGRTPPRASSSRRASLHSIA